MHWLCLTIYLTQSRNQCLSLCLAICASRSVSLSVYSWNSERSNPSLRVWKLTPVFDGWHGCPLCMRPILGLNLLLNLKLRTGRWVRARAIDRAQSEVLAPGKTRWFGSRFRLQKAHQSPSTASEGGALTVLPPLCSPVSDSNFAIGLNLFLGTVGVNVNLITTTSLDSSRIVPSTRRLPVRLVCWCYTSTLYRCDCSV